MKKKYSAEKVDTWLCSAASALKSDGWFVLEGVLDSCTILEAREAMKSLQKSIKNDVGARRLEKAAN